jgi:biotin carboxyl carrier protein
MNITIGIGNMKFTKVYFINILLSITLSLILLLNFGCGKKNESKDEESNITPKANVTITTMKRENVNDTIFLSATSVYNKKTSVEAPITGYVMKVNSTLGNSVIKGNELFVMETKEYHALNPSKDIVDTLAMRKLFGKIIINSPTSGQIMELNAQEGAYVQEGSPLCIIVNISDLDFNLYVPVEYVTYIKTGGSCTIILSNEQRIPARISTLLSKAEVNSQSETYLLKPEKYLIVPEGINVKVFIITQKRDNTQLLPKDAVLSNETLDKFWVMRLINDSTAVKIYVRKGLSSANLIEIVEPQFSSSDKFLLSGNYGLPDTAFVTIQNDSNEK